MVTLAPAASYEQNALRRLYLDAFPRAERKPFRLLCRQARRGRMELLTLRGEAGEPLGLAVTMLHESLVLLDYFAVAPAARGGGIGGEALGLLRERYAGRRFFLEIEALGEPDTPPEQETLRARRKAFYLRNGMRAPGVRACIFGQRMDLLTADGLPVTAAEYRAVYRRGAGRLAALLIRPRIIE